MSNVNLYPHQKDVLEQTQDKVEIWRDIPNYEGLYQVSNLGRIKALTRRVDKGKCHRTWEEHVLKYGLDKKGYLRTNLAKNGINKTIKIHRIVAEVFVPNIQNKPQVNHINGVKSDNRACNLEWVSNGENQKHAFKLGLLNDRSGENNVSAKLTWNDVEFIRKNYKPRDKEFGTIALSRKFNVHRKTISRIINMKLWRKCGDAECLR